jgi:hypothetical protein
MTRLRASRARDVYRKRFLDFDRGIPARLRRWRIFAAANARNFTRRVYRRLTLARDPEKHVVDLIRDGNRFPAFAKPASAGEGRSEKITRQI